MTEPIFHVADAADWDNAEARGTYTQSTRGKTLEQVGFIHCSYRHQLSGVVGAFYLDAPTSHVILTIEPDRLEAPINEDNGFPHIYGPLNTTAVVNVEPLHA